MNIYTEGGLTSWQEDIESRLKKRETLKKTQDQKLE